jgi:hypothetical protein
LKKIQSTNSLTARLVFVLFVFDYMINMAGAL